MENVTNFVKNVKIVEFHDYIWNHREKCIQISTNMPGIGHDWLSNFVKYLLKIANFEKLTKTNFALAKIMTAWLSDIV